MMDADEYIDLELHVDDLMEAAVCGKAKDAFREMRHYLAQYKDDGVCKVYQVIRKEIDVEEYYYD